MSRLFVWISIAILILLILLGFYFSKDSYELLPDFPSKELKVKKFEDWHEFKAQNGKFKVMFPVLPQHATENKIDPKTKHVRKYDMYVSEKNNGTIFMVNLITFEESSNEMQDKEKLLKQTIDDLAASNPKNKITQMNVGAYHNQKALSFTIENPDLIMDGKAFIHDHTLYLLSVIAQVLHYDQKEANFFLNSFLLLHNEETFITPFPLER